MATFPTATAVVAALDKERVPCGPVLSLEEAMDHPHLRERKTVRQASDPSLWRVRPAGLSGEVLGLAGPNGFEGLQGWRR